MVLCHFGFEETLDSLLFSSLHSKLSGVGWGDLAMPANCSLDGCHGNSCRVTDDEQGN